MDISSVTLVAQASQSTGWADAPLSSAANTSDAARFTNLLAGPLAGNPQPADAVVATPPVGAAGSARPASTSLGEDILRGLESVSNSYQEHVQHANGLLDSDANQIGVMDLLKLQVRLVETSMQVEVVTKGVSKMIQNVDQLTKLQ